MSPRRIAAGIPVAAALAYLAHGLVFGLGHAPGGEHAVVLAGGLAAALCALVALAFATGFLRGLPLATGERSVYPPAALLAGALLAFAGIEAGEGHALLWTTLAAAALVLVPLSFFAPLVAQRVAGAAQRAGAAAAAAIATRPRPSVTFAPRALVPAGAGALTCPSRPSRGRAPPLHA